MTLHPIVTAAAQGKLPSWSVVGANRFQHMTRVAELLDGWASTLGRSERERARWRAAGFLHDALREAEAEGLRASLSGESSDLPERVLHGPAAAQRLRSEGITDEPFLNAIAYHTIGHPDLDELGRALYTADFLEPGRRRLMELRASLRERMPEDSARVVTEIARIRIGRLLDERLPIPTETCEFWNALTLEVDG